MNPNQHLETLATCLDSLGLVREAATVRELMEFKQQHPFMAPDAEPPAPHAKKPRAALPSGYEAMRQGPDLFLISGRLYERQVTHEEFEKAVAEIARREEAFAHLPRKSGDVVHAPGMDLMFAKGRVFVRVFRPLTPESQGFVASVQRRETTPELLAGIVRDMKDLGLEKTDGGRPTEQKLLNLASLLAVKGKLALDIYADIPTMQEDLRPYLNRRLPPELAVQMRHSPKRNTIVLKTYDRTLEADSDPPQSGLWIHVLNQSVGDDLGKYLNDFKNVEGEISVSDVHDFHFVMRNYYLALLLKGRPTHIYRWDVGSGIDPWTGRRVLDPSKKDLVRENRTEAFLVPKDARVMAVITDAAKYAEQAQRLGLPVYTNPAAFSTGPDIQIPEALKEFAAPWSSIGAANEIYLLTAAHETTRRRGFLTTDMIKWIRDNDGQIPGGGHEENARWQPDLWDKNSGVMVAFPQRPSHPPSAENVIITRVERTPLVFSYDLPPDFFARLRNDPARLSARLRRLVIQQGQPFSFDRPNSRAVTTRKGFELLKRFIANPPPLPRRFDRLHPRAASSHFAPKL